MGLRVRTLNDPHDARLRPFNRHTLEPAAASRCELTHPSPSARQFRLPFNGLAAAEPRQMFCSCRQLRGTLPRATQHPPACPAWGWGQNGACSTRSEPPSVPRVRADCTCRVFTAKLRVVVHNLAHQLLDHLLTDEPILLARQFCDRDRVDDFICFLGIDFA